MLRRIETRCGAVGFRSPGLDRLGVPHLFTTRIGPTAEWCVRSLDDRGLAALREGAGCDAGAHPTSVKQVHGRCVLEVGEIPPDPQEQADGLVTERDDRLLMVYTADCVPILIAAGAGRRVAAVHAGWRGLIAGVIPAAIERLGGELGFAAIGACLSRERCEMGPEVAEQFVDADLAACVHPGPGDRATVDVREAARLQLERAGVHQVDVSDGCTWSDSALFHSHRRDVTHGPRRRAGSLGALIAVRP